MNSKTNLLNQLKIDRSIGSEDAKKGSVSALTLVLVVFIAMGLAVGGTLYFVDGKITEDNLKAPRKSDVETNSPASEQVAETKEPVKETVPVSNRILNASGYITARRMATVSAEIMGLITDVSVEEGMAVTEGQVLAKLDDALARTTYDLATAQLDVLAARQASIQANLTEAEHVLKRMTELNAKKFASDAEVTRAQASVDSLKASLAAAKADITVAKLEADRQKERLDDHTIRAPFSGIVTVKNAQPGEIVAPTSAGGGFTRTGICTIVDMDSLEIEVDVNEAFIGRVFAGQQVIANLDAYPQWDIPASVIAIIPTADRAKATVKVRISIDEKDPRILPDMGVKVAFLKN